VITPNPSRAAVRIATPMAAGEAGAEPATLEVLDVSGRLVRRMSGATRDDFTWDGRDEGGHAVEPGIYLYRVATPGGKWLGKSLIVR